MAERTAKAIWRGGLKDGSGTVELGSGSLERGYTFQSRFESGAGTNPEELIGAAHAACFSMALAGNLERAGYAPDTIETVATVHLDKAQEGFAITTIELDTQAKVPEVSEDEFIEQAQNAKDTCPVSQALAGARIRLKARLVSIQAKSCATPARRP
jgi:osmotically inducible protein OsmC